jgi:hypothetical protein
MSPPANQANPLPRWVLLCGSAVIGFHLLAVLVLGLAAPSGPWPTAYGSSMALEPQFAGTISRVTTPYLQGLHMTHNYHFASDRPGLQEIYLEVRLKDAKGGLLKTLKLPDEDANFWVRHRQSLLAQALGDDRPVEAPRGEEIPAPGQLMRKVAIWDAPDRRSVHQLREVSEHLIPRQRPVYQPSQWSMVLARSYARYLCRHHQAASAEVIRHSRDAILPALMFAAEQPQGTFDELVCNFGEFRLEK